MRDAMVSVAGWYPDRGWTIGGDGAFSWRAPLSGASRGAPVTIGAIAVGVARPLSAVQFLWINLMSDVLPALALAVEPPERDVMREEPRDRDASILSGRTLLGVGRDAAILAASTLGAYGIAAARYGIGPPGIDGGLCDLDHLPAPAALTCRSDTRSGLADLRQNPLVMGALGGTLTLQVASVAVPVLQRLLGTTPLGLGDWALGPRARRPPGRARDRQGRPRVAGPTRLAGQEDTSG